MTKHTMTRKEHEVILAAELKADRERIFKKFQNRANYLLESSFAETLGPDYHHRDAYCRGLCHGYASAYELVSIWLQEDINKLKEK